VSVKAAHTVGGVEAVGRNEPAVWLDDLYSRHSTELARHLRAKYNAPPDAEDVVQEAYARLAAMENLEISGIQNPKAFLFRMAENIMISLKRRHVVARTYAQGVDLLEATRSDCTPERVLLAKDELEIAARVLHAMPTQRRRCFIMHRFDELTYSEIARLSGMTLNGVKGHVERAMRDIASAVAAKERLESEL
jgi:RNA polymerase sigma-70 factor (ECF subfamily)